ATGGPAHAPAVGTVDVGLRTSDVLDLAVDVQVAVLVGQHGDGAEALVVAGLVEAHLDGPRALRVEGYHAVGGGPVRGAFVDVGEDEDALDLVEAVEVDDEVLAAGDGTGAVVAVEQDVGRVVEVAEGVAEGLHDALVAVGGLPQAGEVEVDGGI